MSKKKKVNNVKKYDFGMYSKKILKSEELRQAEILKVLHGDYDNYKSFGLIGGTCSPR